MGGVLSGLLYGVTSHDPVTFVAVPGVLLVVIVLAMWIPIRRALRLNPLVALKCE
jgi:ABC-type antimicrobial peptide transport system permease subunit